MKAHSDDLKRRYLAIGISTGMVSAKMFTKKLSKVSDGGLSVSNVHADAGVDIATDGSFEDAQDVRSCVLPIHCILLPCQGLQQLQW